MSKKYARRFGVLAGVLAGLLPGGAGCKRDGAAPTAASQPAGDAGERRLGEMEQELRADLPGHALLSRYRACCAAHDRHDRAITFLEGLVEAHPDNPRLRIEYANAFIDKIPTYEGVTAFVKRGNLARKGLGQLDAVLDRHPDLWVALYCRGMNHLHWPKVLGHSDDAVADFSRCLELQHTDEAGPRRAHYLRTHVALGDAYVKAEQYADARAAWRDGLRLFPGADELAERLAIDDDQKLLEYVLSQRSLERGIDTDLSFMDHAR